MMVLETLLNSLSDSYIQVKPLKKDIFPPEISLDVAYQIQHAFTEAKRKNHEILKGYKISMTSPETQALFHAKEPLYGQLTDKQITSAISLSKHMLSPLIELEIIFVVKESLSADATIDEIINRTQIAPGLEIPDSRFEDWFPNMSKEQVCVDGAVGGKVTIGEARSYTYKDIDNMKGKLLHNGRMIDEGTSSSVMGHPLKALNWLLEKLGEHGLTLEAGMFVSSGTFILPKRLEVGTYTGEFEGLGSVTLTVDD